MGKSDKELLKEGKCPKDYQPGPKQRLARTPHWLVCLLAIAWLGIFYLTSHWDTIIHAGK